VFIYGAFLLCAAGNSSDFFLFGLIEERLIIDFIWSLRSFGPIVYTTLKEFKNATITGRFIFLFEEISAREITWFSSSIVFEKVRFKMFSAHMKTQSRRFQIPPVLRAFFAA